MPFAIIASAKPGAWERVSKRIDERRAIVENTRSMNVKRLQNDLQRIAKKEVEFAQKLIEEIIPVRVSWNDDAWEKLQEAMPVRIEPIHGEDDVRPASKEEVKPDIM